MAENDNITMSRIAFERMQAKDERNDRWRNITILLLIILLVATNAMWLIAWQQYDYADTEDYTSIEAEQDGNGVNIAGAGDINYGTEGQDHSENEDKDSDKE